MAYRLHSTRRVYGPFGAKPPFVDKEEVRTFEVSEDRAVSIVAEAIGLRICCGNYRDYWWEYIDPNGGSTRLPLPPSQQLYAIANEPDP